LNLNYIGNRKILYSLSLILLLAMTVIIAFAQPSSAQIGIPQPETTKGYITVAPTLVGVGQEPTVNLWIFPLPTTAAYKPYFNGFYGITVTFVKPDGTKDTFMPVDGTGAYIAGQTQALGAIFFSYKPTMAGNWSVSFTMPAQNITESSGTVQYAGCTSNTFHFTVQTDPVLAGLLNGYPWAQLPNSNVYWSYPINANNREWNQIFGDWTGLTSTMATVNSPTQLRWQPYGSGPGTPHIVWSQPVRPGGIVGGDYGSLCYASQGSNTLANPSVVMLGKVYQNILFGAAGSTTTLGAPSGQFRCFDLATGKLLYTANGTISGGIHIPGNEYVQAASAVALNQTQVLLDSSYGSDYTSYIFGSITVNGVTYWNYYDPITGILMLQLANAQPARLIDGTVLAFGAANGYVYRWNMTKVTNNNWLTGITWNVSLPKPITSPTTQNIFAVSQDCSTIVVYNYAQYWGINADTGASLWNLTLNYQVNTNEEVPLANVDDFIVWDPTAAALKCYSIKTGSLLWTTPSVEDSPWATTWTIYWSETNDLNNLYVSYPDGCVRAYSLKDGHLLWTSPAIPTTEHTENAFPIVNGQTILVGGLLYEYAGYSLGYQINPVPRFSMMLCINATTGEIEWTLNGGVAPNSASNAHLIGQSIFDGNLYCLGKGTTSTSVSAPQTAISAGTPAIISGSVLDTSPASSEATLTANYPNGVPAISDADMSVWMDYLHMQNSTMLNAPPQCTGVPVTLTAVDPNGNTITIGTTTSDDKGNYGLQWTATTSGVYHIYATFAGSGSYYTSSASTYATVASAASPTAAPTSATQPEVSNSDMVMYLAATGIAIIIAIAVVGALILRKK
jgi:hypothetical protein